MSDWARMPSAVTLIRSGEATDWNTFFVGKFKELRESIEERLNENIFLDPVYNAWSFKRRAGAHRDNGVWIYKEAGNG
jgi:hypothetical protein